MSLKQFLAVGRSFAGSPREKSPFEMKKDVRLPNFENAPRFAAKPAVPVQTDWLTEAEHRPALPEPVEAPKSPPAAAKMKTQKRSWLERITFGWLGKRHAGGSLVQAEMNLEKVRVMRNDLRDSDLEVVVNKKEKFALRPLKTAAPAEAVSVRETSPASPAPKKKRGEWTELTAKLFEIGQQ